MTLSKRGNGLWRIGLIGIILVAISCAVWVFVIQGRGDRNVIAKTPSEATENVSKAISVKTICPRCDKNFQLTVERPADVEAYFRANLEAQVAGEVKWINVAPGSQVEKDQLLVRIHVPDKWAVEKEKKNFMSQRETELTLMQQKLKAVIVAVKTSEANVELKKTLLLEAQSQTRLREAQFSRLDQLFRKDAQDKNVRDEALFGLEYAQAAEKTAVAARIKAEAELEDAKANVDITRAEVERAKQLIEVAKADHEQAAAIAEYAQVKAPFRGTVVSRYIDPGSFVQNASTGHATPMLTLERSDIVTVAMRVPDNYAPYISSRTDAILELDALPGLIIRGKVTRFAPSLVTAAHDRTMRVDVDLWNETPERYRSFFADNKNLADLKEGERPILPEITGKTNNDQSKRLIPGMYGNMKLILKAFGQIELIPSQAILRQGGRTAIYVVKDGKAHQMPVKVQVDDGTMAHVVMLGNHGEILGRLADCEQVIVSNQEELSEGQAVNPVPRENWASSKPAHSRP
jgi:multidrug resistance efflux pump